MESNSKLLPHQNGLRPFTSVDLLNPCISLLGDFGVSLDSGSSDWLAPPRSNRINAGREALELWAMADKPEGLTVCNILSTGLVLI